MADRGGYGSTGYSEITGDRSRRRTMSQASASQASASQAGSRHRRASRSRAFRGIDPDMWRCYGLGTDKTLRERQAGT